MARAKRTDRAEARRHHRAEISSAEYIEADAVDAPSAAPSRRPDGSPRPPSIGTAFRASFRPFDWKGDLRALPTLLRHRSFLIPLALTVGATAIAFLTNSQVNPEAPAANTDTTAVIAGIAFQYFVVAPPVGSAFIAGFLAPRASWLIGLMIGVVAFGCLALLVFSPMFDAVPDQRSQYVANAAFVSPTGAALFAAAAAWYRRFLNLANPARAQQQAQRQAARARQGNRSGPRSGNRR